MRITAKTKYLNEAADLVFGFYGDGSTAIQLVSVDGEPLAKATVCIVDYGFTPPDGSVVIKDYSENVGMLACLIDQGVIHPAEMVVAGPNEVTFPVCRLTAKALAHVEIPDVDPPANLFDAVHA